ncbi:unnamed protein product [Caenorhabditis auriculariae]|uniref:Uncharacterized protein n=1 Tax=Caenorhabditis auriculariae TaxID=2777116 RepID=A0A8S1HR10_9PELO|nr:unnamed protein product [Caenorhabditis auriculariae]
MVPAKTPAIRNVYKLLITTCGRRALSLLMKIRNEAPPTQADSCPPLPHPVVFYISLALPHHLPKPCLLPGEHAFRFGKDDIN